MFNRSNRSRWYVIIWQGLLTVAGIMSEGSFTGDNAPIIPLSKAYVRPHRKDSLQKTLTKTKRNHGQEYVSKSSGNYSLFARLVHHANVPKHAMTV